MQNTSPANNSWHMKAIAGALGIGLLAFGGYAMHEHDAAAAAAQQNAQVNASLQATNAQVSQLTSKLNDIEAQRAAAVAQQKAAAQARQQQAAARKAKASASHTVRRDDPRWNKMQAQLDAHQAALDATNQNIDATNKNLESAKTELSGSIAKTHAQLVALQRKGERNYYEFDITKEKNFRHEGPIGIRLRKANTKHSYADLELLVDDRSMSQKHVNLLQPSIFYAADSEAPVEIVINAISKDHIHGYVSAPKYRRSELAVSDPQTVTPVDPNSNSPTLKTRSTQN